MRLMQSGNSCTWQAKPFWFLFQLKVDTSTILLSVAHFNTGVLGVDADGRLDVFLARICVRGSLHLQPLLPECLSPRVCNKKIHDSQLCTCHSGQFTHNQFFHLFPGCFFFRGRPVFCGLFGTKVSIHKVGSTVECRLQVYH